MLNHEPSQRTGQPTSIDMRCDRACRAHPTPLFRSPEQIPPALSGSTARTAIANPTALALFLGTRSLNVQAALPPEMRRCYL